MLQVVWSLTLYQYILDQSVANGGAVFVPLGQSVPSVPHAPQVKANCGLHFPELRNGEIWIGNVNGGTTCVPWTPVHTEVQACLAQEHSVLVWLQSTVSLLSPLNLHTRHMGYSSMSEPCWHSLALRLTSYFIDGGHRVPVGVVLSAVTIVVGACFSLSLSNLRTEGSSDRSGKVFSCLISSVSRASVPNAQQCPVGSLKYPLLK